MTKPAVVLIGASKGGVGKTTVARTLLDYFADRRVSARALDTEVPKGTLKRFHPDVTDIVDINHVPDQMRIFDTVNSTDASVSLIDVRAGLLSPTLQALRDTWARTAITANELSCQLRATEDRINQLQAEIEQFRNRAVRAEAWLQRFQSEIKQKLIGPRAPTRFKSTI